MAGIRLRIAILALSLHLAGCAPQTNASAIDDGIRFERLSANPVEHGERIASVLGCKGCHGKELTGIDWSDELGTLWTANLTRSVAEHSDEQLLAMIKAGKRPDRSLMEMPSFLFTQLHDSDLNALIDYLRRIPPNGEVHPPPTIGPKLAAQIAAGDYLDAAQEVERNGNTWPPDMGPQHARARYMVRATCAECHKLDLRGEDPPSPEERRSADLRIVASYDAADFSRLMRTGKAAGNREVGLMSEVARNRFAHLSDNEVEAIRAYLVEVARRDP
ncbi:MAG: c-type cytochrome [Erythrobacter sp.]